MRCTDNTLMYKCTYTIKDVCVKIHIYVGLLLCFFYHICMFMRAVKYGLTKQE